MKFLFYIAILGAIGLGIVIFLEKNKKPSNVLIEDKQPEPERKNQSATESNLNQNQNIQSPRK
jgi:hypothetical protein